MGGLTVRAPHCPLTPLSGIRCRRNWHRLLLLGWLRSALAFRRSCTGRSAPFVYTESHPWPRSRFLEIKTLQTPVKGDTGAVRHPSNQRATRASELRELLTATFSASWRVPPACEAALGTWAGLPGGQRQCREEPTACHAHTRPHRSWHCLQARPCPGWGLFPFHLSPGPWERFPPYRLLRKTVSSDFTTKPLRVSAGVLSLSNAA